MSNIKVSDNDLLNIKKAQSELDALVNQYNTLHATYMKDVGESVLEKWNIKYPIRLTGVKPEDVITPPTPFSVFDTSSNCFKRCFDDNSCGFATFSLTSTGNKCALYKAGPDITMTATTPNPCGGANQAACAVGNENKFGYEKPVWENKPFTNAISQNTPPLTTPGQNIGADWIYLGTPETLEKCQENAVKHDDVFTKVVYINDPTPGRQQWHKSCYGAKPGARTYETNTTPLEYTTSIPPYGYTKLATDGSGQMLRIQELARLKKEIDDKNIVVTSLMRAAFGNTDTYLSNIKSGTNAGTNAVVASNADWQTKMFDDKDGYYTKLLKTRNEMKQTGNNINVYDEINTRKMVNVYRYKFALMVTGFIIAIIAFNMYMSKYSVADQFRFLGKYLYRNWWVWWWAIVVFILFYFITTSGWDAREFIIKGWREITNPEYWIGKNWWVGVLILVFLYAIYFVYQLQSGQMSNNGIGAGSGFGSGFGFGQMPANGQSQLN